MNLAVLALVGVIVMCGCLLSSMRGLGEWNLSYTRLGKRYCGKQPRGAVLHGFLLSTPTLMFDYGRTFCILKSRRQWLSRGSETTELKMTWPNPQLQFELNSPPSENRAGRMSQVSMNPTQSRTWSAASNQPKIAQQMLSESIMWHVEQLRQLPPSRDLQVMIGRGHLHITKRGYLKSYESLDDFVRLGLELFDQLMLIFAEGIEFVGSDEAVVCTEVKCPICSEQVSEDMVVCPRCKTPHCLDCWEYNGQCATYACRETRYHRVASANRTRPA